MNIREFLQLSPVIPVIVVDDIEAGVMVAKALVKGGLRVLEITLRTEKALEAIKAIITEVPEAIVGVGTVIKPEQFELAKKIGVQFAITPGLTSDLAKAAKNAEMPLIPGVMSPSDILYAQEFGFQTLKFFPAQAAGGTAMLKSFLGPFPHIMFCPTGGITPINAKEYLALPNVSCVGGSWLCSPALIKAKAWDNITELAKVAASLGGQ